ncbi:MAG TPA: deoxyguanosinetriphosphate triphosphohydrolase [Myxococcota bacterium]|nr:deoxyguanosinetriphosphate triphosphohydrolase [Myxococcota bacterium]
MHIRKMLEQQEHLVLHPAAAFSDSSRGRERQAKSCPVRPAFQHDRDKILHCKAFRRLPHKTQVFLSPRGDHYRTRMTHTLEVSQIARTLARALRLNEQLTEAIALGHDLGHTPFGHAGEDALRRLMPGGFRHVDQSVRVVQVLENDGRGLNLTFEVIDGIAKHSKGRGNIMRGADKDLPATLEGQLVRISDIVAYVNHDTDDALRGGIIKQGDIPSSLLGVLGRTHSQRIARAVKDVLSNTDLDREPLVRIGADMEAAIRDMRDFLWERVYDNPTVHDEFIKCHTMLEQLFNLFLEQPVLFGRVSDQRVPDVPEHRRRMVCDFLAGMTDRYAINLFKKLFIPRPWPVSHVGQG